MKTKILVAVCIFLIGTSAYSKPNYKFKPITKAKGYVHDKYITTPKDITRDMGAYFVSFDSADDDNQDGKSDIWGIPEFVAYEMKAHPAELTKGPDRPDSWITPKDLYEKGLAPTDDTYAYPKSFRDVHPNWYERGHMCMKQHAWRIGFNEDWNTHTVINAVPQRAQFNQGIWESLEEKTADWANKYGSVWIITGPIFNTKRTPTNWLGEEGEMKIAIPDELFKIVIKESDDNDIPDVLAFVFPQEGSDYGCRKGNCNQAKYLQSVKKVEELTGLNFFSRLSKTKQSRIESDPAKELWN